MIGEKRKIQKEENSQNYSLFPRIEQSKRNTRKKGAMKKNDRVWFKEKKEMTI